MDPGEQQQGQEQVERGVPGVPATAPAAGAQVPAISGHLHNHHLRAYLLCSSNTASSACILALQLQHCRSGLLQEP